MQRKEASLHAAVRAGIGKAGQVFLARSQGTKADDLCELLLSQGCRNAQAGSRDVPAAVWLAAFERLCDSEHGYLERDPTQAINAARALLACARAAKHALRRRAVLADLRAEAWAALANAYRVQEDFAAAEAAWKRVAVFLRAGTGNPVLAGEVEERRASLWRAEREFEKARDCLRLAELQYIRIGDLPRLSRVKLLQGWLLRHAGDSPGAAELAFSALQLLEPAAVPALALACLHLIAFCIADAGDPLAALYWLRLYEPAYAEAGIPMLHLRASWLKGRLYARLKRWREAQEQLEHVRKEFLARQLDYDTALAGVDLAVVFAEQRQLSAVWLLGQEMYPVFLSKNIPREASAVLILRASGPAEEGGPGSHRRAGGTARSHSAQGRALRVRPPRLSAVSATFRELEPCPCRGRRLRARPRAAALPERPPRPAALPQVPPAGARVAGHRFPSCR